MYFKTIRVKLIFVIGLWLLAAGCGGGKQTNNAEVSPTDSIANDALVKTYSAEIEKDPTNAESYYRRGIAYYNLKYLNRALTDMEDAIKFNPENPLYQYQKGRICYAMNRTMDAEKAYLSAIALKEDYTEAQMKLAELYYLVKKHRESLNLLNTLTAKNPDKYDAWFFKGMNYKESGDTMKAIASFQRSLEADPDFYDAAIQLGVLFTAKNNASAVDYLTSAIRMQKSNPEAYFFRAVFYQLRREYQKALFDYRKVIDLDPSNDQAYYNVGRINYDVKQYEEALRAFNICIQMNNANLDAYYMRGLVLELKGNKEDAQRNYRYVLEKDPEYVLAKERLSK